MNNILNTTFPNANDNISDGVALTSMPHPEGVLESIAEAIISGKLATKKEIKKK